MQTASYGIWTRVSESIYYKDNHYNKNASINNNYIGFFFFCFY